MPARAIIDIDVNDTKFKAFNDTFQKFNTQLSKLPDAWKGAEAAQGEMGKGFQSMTASLLTQLDLLRRQQTAERDAARGAREVEGVWSGISRNTRSALGNITGMTSQLLKWTALTGVFSGLLGAGGLFGIERLASSVGSGRRSALGTGISYGEQRAFGLNYNRIVDPDSFLGAVNEAQSDVTKRSSLYGAGLRSSDIDGKDSAQLGVQLLGQLKRIVDATPQAQLAQTLQARGLDRFLSLQDAQRLRNTSAGELGQLGAAFGRDQRTLGLTDGNAKVWTDFSNQLSRAGDTIENTFVHGLQPLIPALDSLSASATKAISTFLEAPKLKEWIGELGTALERFAKYVGTEDFQTNIAKFVESVGTIADAVVRVAGFIGGGVSNTVGAIKGTMTNPAAAYTNSDGKATWGVGGAVPRNNPGNLRPPGSGTGFQQFATPEEGYRAMQRQLMLYYNRDHLSSVGQIVGKWAPPSENDTGSYMGDVAKQMNVNAMQRLDLSDPDTMSKLVAAMAHHENGKNKVTPDQVKIMIYGAPGGNTIANAQQTTTPGN